MWSLAQPCGQSPVPHASASSEFPLLTCITFLRSFQSSGFNLSNLKELDEAVKRKNPVSRWPKDLRPAPVIPTDLTGTGKSWRKESLEAKRLSQIYIAGVSLE
jgi:hypothetical protein